MNHGSIIQTIIVSWFFLMAAFSGKACQEQKAKGTNTIQSNASQKTGVVKEGVWGGPHILMEVTQSGATITYDCAVGTIDQRIQLDSDGRFDARGTHTRQNSGPVRSDETPDRHPARYTGRIDGNRMTLVLTLTDTKENVGTFTLTYGEKPELTRCA